ncbi:MAG TPA: hypothetical protein VKW77_11210, partial [Acidimicrobiales bacterium]|nr:hypothetical protein [Acidimicrobiales bacterium]
MALVIVIALAWLVVLVPGYLRRRSANDETDSISHFHHQLRVLEHSAPAPIVAPAYRLRDGQGDPVATVGWRSSDPPTITVAGARDLPRPALAFLSDDSYDAVEAGPRPPSSPPATT